MRISVILPAKNEAEGLRRTLAGLRELLPDSELIVVDDGSTDETAAVAREHGADVLSSPYSMGNGAAIKRGARAATGEVLVFMDADGQHDPADAKRLVDFAAGLVFATRGTIERITSKVFLLSPPNVSVAAEDKARLVETGGFFNQS